ncbi:MAG: AbrB/MazE/SpoVT family DNA-binding domain-containing protein [Dokdonella sp.]
MTILTITAKGQLTLRKEVLAHLGVKPGDKVEVDLLPDGRGVLRATKPSADIHDFIGLLAGRTRKRASLDEIEEAAAQGWAGRE